MSATRTIEDYAEEIVQHVKDVDFDNLSSVSDTLMRMKYSNKKKHKLNYWRVLQCLGEIASDNLVTFLSRIEKKSCKCHLNDNMKVYLRLFVESMCNVKVVKRMLVHKTEVVPVLFRAIRQHSDPHLTMTGLDAMVKFAVVGRTELVEFIVKYGIMKDIYQIVKAKYDNMLYTYGSLNVVLTCSKLLLTFMVHGNESIRKQVRRASSTRMLSEYVDNIRTSEEARRKFNVDKSFDMDKLLSDFLELRAFINDEKEADVAMKLWSPKMKLQQAQEQDQLYVFCSSPCCRKIYTETEKFRYCGACRLARYCSKGCQQEHWRKGHKDTCQRETSLVHD